MRNFKKLIMLGLLPAFEISFAENSIFNNENYLFMLDGVPIQLVKTSELSPQIDIPKNEEVDYSELYKFTLDGEPISFSDILDVNSDYSEQS